VAAGNASVYNVSLPVGLVIHLKDRFPGTLICISVTLIKEVVL
jgi:hypothetical protein